uniref:Putative wd40-repeat-containing subunit of the 18s rrna processing complex n=1 Tax=Amblyomma triste TaxID=251400 RepID=A0A023GM38_AMBTT
MSKSDLKENFKLQEKYDAFYTGRFVEWPGSGNHLYCQHGTSVKVLNVEDGKVSKCFDLGEEEDVTAFTVSADEATLAVSGRSGLLRQWDLQADALTRTWKSFHQGPVSCMVFDSTSTLLASGGCDSTVKVWDVVRQYCTHHLRGAQGVFSVVSFHPDSQVGRLFGAADDYHIHVWDLSKSTLVGSLEGHFSVVTDLQFLEKGSQLLSSSRDKVVILWDADALTSLKTIPVYESVESLIVVPDSSPVSFITAGEKGLLRTWNLNTGICTHEQEKGPSGEEEAITRLRMCPERKLLAVVTFDHNITLRSLENFSIERQFVGHNDEVLDMRFLGREERFLAVATNSPQVRIFQLDTFHCQLLKGHADTVVALDTFPSDPTLLATVSKDNTVKLWRQQDDGFIECLFTGKGHTQAVAAVACSRLSASFLVTGSQDTTLKLWAVPERPRLVSVVDPCAGASMTSQITVVAHEKDINGLAVSPNDQLIASASQDKTAKLWNAADLSLVGTFRGHRRSVWCTSFSPVDQVLATSSADTTIKLWSLSDFSCVKTFEGHECSVLKVVFVTHGMQLLSSGADGNLKLWNVNANECMQTLDQHEDKAWALALSADESLLITGAADSTILVWKDCTSEERQEAFEKQEALILQEQQLSNLLKEKKWTKALQLALTLEHPFRALNIIKEILLEDRSGETLTKALAPLRDDQIDLLLKFASTWNTNSKHSAAAQAVLNVVLRSHSPSHLLGMPGSRATIEAFIPYTERHFQRVSRLKQQAMFLEYLWCNMKVAGHEAGESRLE